MFQFGHKGAFLLTKDLQGSSRFFKGLQGSWLDEHCSLSLLKRQLNSGREEDDTPIVHCPCLEQRGHAGTSRFLCWLMCVRACALVHARHAGKSLSGQPSGLWWLVPCQGCTYLLTYLCESRIFVPRQMRERAFRS